MVQFLSYTLVSCRKRKLIKFNKKLLAKFEMYFFGVSVRIVKILPTFESASRHRVGSASGLFCSVSDPDFFGRIRIRTILVGSGSGQKYPDLHHHSKITIVNVHRRLCGFIVVNSIFTDVFGLSINFQFFQPFNVTVESN